MCRELHFTYSTHHITLITNIHAVRESSENRLHVIFVAGGYVKSEDSDPCLPGLWPISDAEVVWSPLLYRLPCAEDVREFAFPSLNHFASAYNTPKYVIFFRALVLNQSVWRTVFIHLIALTKAAAMTRCGPSRRWWTRSPCGRKGN
jgi:hypothetical protein